MKINSSVTYNPEFYLLFESEKHFNGSTVREWMNNNNYVLWCCVATYLAFVLRGESYMKTKKRFGLTRALILWNSFLCLFSVAAAIRCWTEAIYVLRTFGFQYSVCNVEDAFHNSTSSFWGMLFVISKLLEFGDTAFIILRKRKLILLHWYHHLTVMIFAWHLYIHKIGISRWVMLLNSTIHSIMYLYYASATAKFKIPRLAIKALTTLQIVQISLALALMCQVYRFKSSGDKCDFPELLVLSVFIVCFTYLVLFCNFFYRNYIRVDSPSVKLVKSE